MLDVAFNVKRLPGWGALRDNETPADIERQSKASITEPCDRDLRFDDGRAANGGDDRADFVVSIMRVIDRLATPESHEIADAALASDRGPEETKPQLSGSVLLSRLIVGNRRSPGVRGGTVVGLNQTRVTSSPRCQTNPRSMGIISRSLRSSPTTKSSISDIFGPALLSTVAAPIMQ
jgi:hypothetical protein